MAALTRFRVRPFPHWLVDDFLPADTCYSLAAAMQSCRSEWTSRPSDYEPGKFEVPIDPRQREMVAGMAAAWAADNLPTVGIDQLWHGAGAQAMVAGARLDPHLDHTHAPDGRPIAYKAVIFVHTTWNTDWGGELELWWIADANPIPVALYPARRYSPRPGRMVVMANCQSSAHGVAPVSDKATLPRLSILVNFVGPEPDFQKRPRALFLPRFDDTAMDVERRLARAGLSGNDTV